MRGKIKVVTVAGHVGRQFHAFLGVDDPVDAAHKVHHWGGSETEKHWETLGSVANKRSPELDLQIESSTKPGHFSCLQEASKCIYQGITDPCGSLVEPCGAARLRSMCVSWSLIPVR